MRRLVALLCVAAACQEPVAEVEGVPVLEGAVLDFGTVTVGQTSSRSFRLRNTGNGSMRLLGLEATSGPAVGRSASATEVFNAGLESVLPPGAAVQVEVVFRPPRMPVHVRDYTTVASLRLEGGRGGGTTSVTVTLRGRAVGSACAVPEVLDFGPVELGARAQETLFLPEPLEGELGPTLREATGDAAFSVPGKPKRGKAWMFVEVAFLPSEERTYRGFVEVQAQSFCPWLPVELRGQGVARALSWAPAALDFGAVAPGGRVERVVTFTNLALMPVGLEQLGVTDAAFALPGPSAVVIPGASLVGGVRVPGTAEVRVAFSPAAEGQVSGALRAQAKGVSVASVQVPLTGLGGVARLRVSPWPVVDVGRVAFFGGWRGQAVRLVALSNEGTRVVPPDARLAIKLGRDGDPRRTFEVTPGFETSAEELCLGEVNTSNGQCTPHVLPSSLPSDGSVFTVPFRVVPAWPGRKFWTVKLYYNDGAAEQALQLEVRARAEVLPRCRLAVEPRALDFGVVAVGHSRTLPVVFRNLGQGVADTCLVTNVGLSPAGSGAFELPGGALDELSLQPGEARVVEVRARPSTEVPSPATSSLHFSASTFEPPPPPVALSVRPGASCLVVAPSVLSFGALKPGCGAVERRVRVYNTCTSTQVSLRGGDFRFPVPRQGDPGCRPGTCVETYTADTTELSGTLEPAASRAVTFRFRATALGPLPGAYQVRGTASGADVSQVVSLKGLGEPDGWTVDTFPLAPRAADILFVVDDSCSMADEQERLAANFASFIGLAQSSGVDFHLAVMSTNPVRGSVHGRFAATASGAKVLTRATPLLETEFSRLAKVGVGGYFKELCFEPALTALSAPYVGDPQVNAGFLRPQAALRVVCVSDEAEQSPRPVSWYMDQLSALKSELPPGAFQLHAIANFPTAPGVPCSFDNDDSRYREAVRLTGGVGQSICASDWVPGLSAVSRSSFGAQSLMPLSGTPDLQKSPLEVRNGGVDWPAVDARGATSWRYDAPSNSIVVEQPPSGAASGPLTVRYQSVCNP